MAQNRVHLSVEAVREHSERALRGIGYDAEEARILTDHVIDAALCGYEYSGLAKILNIPVHRRFQRPCRPLSIIRETEVSVLYDGGNNVGMLTMYHATRTAIARANLLVPRADFKAELAALIGGIKSAPPAPGFDEIRIPASAVSRAASGSCARASRSTALSMMRWRHSPHDRGSAALVSLAGSGILCPRCHHNGRLGAIIDSSSDKPSVYGR